MIEYLFLSKEYRFVDSTVLDTFLSKKDTLMRNAPFYICTRIKLKSTLLWILPNDLHKIRYYAPLT